MEVVSRYFNRKLKAQALRKLYNPVLINLGELLTSKNTKYFVCRFVSNQYRFGAARSPEAPGMRDREG